MADPIFNKIILFAQIAEGKTTSWPELEITGKNYVDLSDLNSNHFYELLFNVYT